MSDQLANGSKVGRAGPLTPALSPRERESRIPSFDKSERVVGTKRLATILPLPSTGRGPG